MRRSRLSLALLLAAATAPFMPEPTRAELFPGSVVELGSWQLSANTRGRELAFDYCAISRMQNEGFGIVIGHTVGGVLGMSARAPAWGLTPGQAYPASFAVGASSFTFTGYALSTGSMDFKTAPEFFAELKSGLQLGVSANQRYFTMNLDGIEAATARLNDCVKKYTGRTLAPAQTASARLQIQDLVFLQMPILDFPPASLRAGEQGLMIIDVEVDDKGWPKALVLEKSSGHPALDKSALAALKDMRIQPYTVDGKPQPVRVRFPIRFVLQQSPGGILNEKGLLPR